ncbi:hypothetical protein CYMTET_47647 [Cymbomonas tetramitiformis]|uniref:Uncharacterized protein n=1 Tax=Cymbomonas tetramitiformis TaxID=36881 RepID=A0AAE0BTV5_9CHLO|nr:hypothetical protein CYMTET_47647 [Cymbomonas tetramitiformis]
MAVTFDDLTGAEAMAERQWLDLTWAEFMHASTGCAAWRDQLMVWAAILGSLFSGDRLLYLTLSVSRSDILRYQRLQVFETLCTRSKYHKFRRESLALLRRAGYTTVAVRARLLTVMPDITAILAVLWELTT